MKPSGGVSFPGDPPKTSSWIYNNYSQVSSKQYALLLEKIYVKVAAKTLLLFIIIISKCVPFLPVAKLLKSEEEERRRSKPGATKKNPGPFLNLRFATKSVQFSIFGFGHGLISLRRP